MVRVTGLMASALITQILQIMGSPDIHADRVIVVCRVNVDLVYAAAVVCYLGGTAVFCLDILKLLD